MVRDIGDAVKRERSICEKLWEDEDGVLRFDAPEAPFCCEVRSARFRRNWCARASVSCRRILGELHVTLKAPFVDDLGVKAPVGSDPKPGELTAAQKLVDSGGMHPEIVGQ